MRDCSHLEWEWSLPYGLGGAGVEPPPAGVELPALDGRDPLGLLAAVGLPISAARVQALIGRTTTKKEGDHP